MRYEQYAQALTEMGVSLEILIFPPGQSRHEEELDQVVPKEEARDFFHWLGFQRLKKTEISWSTSSVFHHSSRMHSEKLDDEDLDGMGIF